MGLLGNSSAEVRALRGPHLYPFALSNCSQRVASRPSFERTVASHREAP